MATAFRPPPRLSERVTVGRWVARVLCFVFALVGALPLATGALVRSDPVQDWASAETARVLQELLGVKASYQVELALWPLHLAVNQIRVESTDGGEPLLTAAHVQVTPRLFSLLAGRLDVGDIELEGTKLRLIVKGGKLQNFDVKLPESGSSGTSLSRAPFSTLAITDASFDVEVDDLLIRTGNVDLDVLVDKTRYDVALRIPQSAIDNVRHKDGSDAFDEDVLCQLDLRLSLEPGSVLVQRLSVLGAMDLDEAKGTRPTCAVSDALPEADQHGRVALRLSQFRVAYADSAPTFADGHVVARAPLDVLNRYLDGPKIHAWVGFTGDVRHDLKKKLPELRGQIRVGEFMLDGRRLVEHANGEVQIDGERIFIPKLISGYGGGDVQMTDITLDPLAEGIPLRLGQMKSQGVSLQGLLRDIDVTSHSWVRWEWPDLRLADFKGTLNPLLLSGDVTSRTTDFAVFDRGFDDPARQTMLGLKQADLSGRFVVNPQGVHFNDFQLTFGTTKVLTSVTVGFHDELMIDVDEGTSINLADIGPISNLELGGVANLTASLRGSVPDVELTGKMAVSDLSIAGFPVGQVDHADVAFRPLRVDFTNLVGSSGASDLNIPALRLTFDSEASVVADGTLRSKALHLTDFYRVFHLEEDPKWKDLHAVTETNARVTFTLGGPYDTCKTGRLRADGEIKATGIEVFGERFESGVASFELDWRDLDAGYRGFTLDAPSLALRKGTGTLLGSVQVQAGAEVRGNLVGSGIPLRRVQGLGDYVTAVDGTFSAVAELRGKLDALEATLQTRVGRVRFGTAEFPSSNFSVELQPLPLPAEISPGKTACGHLIPGPSTATNRAASAAFLLSGQLFGGQFKTQNLRVTQETNPHVSGTLELDKVDLGKIAGSNPQSKYAGVDGRLSAQITVQDLPLNAPGSATGTAELRELWVQQNDLRVDVREAHALSINNGTLNIPRFALVAATRGGQRGVFDVKGGLYDLKTKPRADVSVTMRPTNLSTFSGLIPRLERASGQLSGQVTLSGPLPRVAYRGAVALNGGVLAFRDSRLSLSNMDIALAFEPGELRIVNGAANVGGGTVRITGSVPLNGFELGEARTTITANGISVTPAPGITAQLDARLTGIWEAAKEDTRPIPRVVGDVIVQSFEYSRPATLTADITTLAKRGKRTSFESYDPRNDYMEFDLQMHSARPLYVRNNLAEASFVIDEDPGLRVAGTNQRFGARGTVRFEQGGRIHLRRNEFEVRQGTLRFDDLTRLEPRLDLTAITDYRRFSSGGTSSNTATGSPATDDPDATSSLGGSGNNWRIKLHAHGDAEAPKIDLSSEPDLAEDDIFLLLTLGLTRTELDQAQSASLGSSVALEALGAITGADDAVSEAVPVIDEFRLGSSYSPRTGRTEPTVTIGKRLSERIRAYVTSSISDAREVRSNVEWRLDRRMSVQGSYDNVNAYSSAGLGNLGADLRWRLEFE